MDFTLHYTMPAVDATKIRLNQVTEIPDASVKHVVLVEIDPIPSCSDFYNSPQYLRMVIGTFGAQGAMRCTGFQGGYAGAVMWGNE